MEIGGTGAGAERINAEGQHTRRKIKASKVGAGTVRPQRQRWAGWAASDAPALGPGGAKVPEAGGH